MIPRKLCQPGTAIMITCVMIVLGGCNAPGPSEPRPHDTPNLSQPATATAIPPTEIPPTRELNIKTEFSDEGRTLYLDSGEVRVGVDTRWGGAIREIWYQGENLVNNYDGGRLVGVAFYDSDRPATTSHPNDTGWNPTPSDMHDHTNEPIEVSYEDGILYTKTRYLQWFPNDKGGGPGSPVPTDIVVENWLRFFTDEQVIQLRYRLTNEGDLDHAVHAQEFPFLYPRTPYSRYVTYSSIAPWTKDEVETVEIPMGREAGGQRVASEGWAAMLNSEGRGLTLWAPQAYPIFSYKHFNNSGPVENDSLYLQPRTFLAIGPGASIETEAFLFIGTWQQARLKIYRFMDHFSFPDVMFPYGFVDQPKDGVELSGTTGISGWAIDDRGLDRIEIHIDGEAVGEAEYGQPRPDVVENYPGLPAAPGYGYNYQLNSRELDNGLHTLEAVAVDRAGNESVLRPGEITITVDN